jgi:iron complex transport system substrate-binding protein
MKITGNVLLLMICTICTQIFNPNARTIIDMAGRTVTVPDTIRKVYQASPVAEVLLYAIAPQMLIGTGFRLTDNQKKYLNQDYAKKLFLGMMGGGKNNTFNPEQIIKMHPDIVLSTMFSKIEKIDIESTERMQEQLGIPVILTDGSLEKSDSTCIFIGNLLSVHKRADSLATYIKKLLNEVAAVRSSLPKEKQIRVFYAEGNNGLYTDPAGSRHAEVLEYAGGNNVATLKSVPGAGMLPVSIEQVLVWKPEMIIVCPSGDAGAGRTDDNYNQILNDPTWKSLVSVKSGMVFKIPAMPFNWFDRPPGLNRILGVRWLTKLMYPSVAHWNIRDDTKTFYKVVYHQILKDSQLDEILSNAERK